MTLSILCPTRERPGMARRLKDSIDAEVLFYVDDDDPKRDQYEDLDPIVGPYVGVGRAWNVLARHATGDYLMMGNDDLEFLEPVIPNCPPDEPRVIWFDDGSPDPENCHFPLVTRAWYEALGYFTPECFDFLYHAGWVGDVGKRAGLWEYIPQKVHEHHHVTFGKMEYDETFWRNRRTKSRDKQIFDTTTQERQTDAEIVLSAWKQWRA